MEIAVWWTFGAMLMVVGVVQWSSPFPSLVRRGAAKRRGGAEREPGRAKHKELFEVAKPL